MSKHKLLVWLGIAMLGLLFLRAGTAVAQAPITPIYTQNFDSIGTSETATLPANWRVDKNNTVRTVGTWTDASAATERRGGNNMANNAANGIYNFGAGDPATATDRAIGWIIMTPEN